MKIFRTCKKALSRRPTTFSQGELDSQAVENMTYTYTQTITTYTYTCQRCGTRVSGQSSVWKCRVCDLSVCPSCYHYGFCTDHWNNVPPDLQQAIANSREKSKRRTRMGYVQFAVCMALGIIALTTLSAARQIAIGFILFIIFVLMAFLAIPMALKNFKNRGWELEKLLAPYLASIGVQSSVTPVTVPTVVVSPSPPIEANKPAAATRACLTCGAIISTEAIYCEKCGTKLR